MKKLLAILTIATLLCSCSAEKRLARFLEHHPELQRIDTVMIHDTIILPADSAKIRLTLQQLIAMDSAARAASTEEEDTTITAKVSNDRSSAALQANGDGTFDLSSIAKPDTIYKNKPVYIPHYITEKEKIPIEVYKQRWWQEGLMWIGILATLLSIIRLIAWFIVKFIKPS